MIPKKPVSDNPYQLSSLFLHQSRVDDAGGGYCAKGVANLLEHVGLGCQRGDAYTWKDSLPKNGWIKLEGVTPDNAPPGAVLVYDRNSNHQGKSGGAAFGHVEIATVDVNGKRQYVSDKARDNWGGTVPQNFVGVYVHPSLHKTMDGIHYTPNLDGNSGIRLAQNQTGSSTASSNGRRDGNNTLATDATYMNLFTNRTPGSQQGENGNASSFNNNANMSAFVVLAVMISAIYGIDMDTGGRAPVRSPDSSVLPTSTAQASVLPTTSSTSEAAVLR